MEHPEFSWTNPNRLRSVVSVFCGNARRFHAADGSGYALVGDVVARVDKNNPQMASRLTGTHNPTAEKVSEYECGFPAFEEPRSQFDVRFYLVAISFIIFDLEAAFLFPWAVSLDDTGWIGWGAMMTFLAILAIGLTYEWKKGALEWE